MSPSKTGLNAEFYKWIDDVRRAMRKEKELQEKLRYYNMKLTSCRGMTYDRNGSAGTAGGEKDLYYWMGKIEETEKSMEKYQYFIREYQQFQESLNAERKVVLDDWLAGKGQKEHLGRNSGSLQRNEMARLWKKFQK